MKRRYHSPVKLVASTRNWIQSEAVDQLFKTARLEGVHRAVRLPDLHPGKGRPNGAAFVTEDVIYPHLIGDDVGCGMALWQTGLPENPAQLESWASRPFDLEHPWEGSMADWIYAEGLIPSAFDSMMGTLGGGNHFAELQAVDQIVDSGAFRELGLVSHHLMMLIHSGSRGLGEMTQFGHSSQHGTEGLLARSSEGLAFMSAHDQAVRWARSNPSVPCWLE